MLDHYGTQAVLTRLELARRARAQWASSSGMACFRFGTRHSMCPAPPAVHMLWSSTRRAVGGGIGSDEGVPTGGAAEQVTDHEEMACASALRQQQLLSQLRAQWQSDGLPPGDPPSRPLHFGTRARLAMPTSAGRLRSVECNRRRRLADLWPVNRGPCRQCILASA